MDKIYNLLLNKIDNLTKNFKYKKYSNKYYLDAIIYSVKSGCSWRKITENPLIGNDVKKNHYSSIFKTYNKWTKLNLFSLTYKDLLLKYEKKTLSINDNYLLSIDTTTINNICGKDLLGKYYLNKKKTTKISIICDSDKVPISIKLFTGNYSDSKTLYTTLDNNLIKDIMLCNTTILADRGYTRKNNNITNNIKLLTYSKKNQKPNTNYEKSLLIKRYVIENLFGKLKSYGRIRNRFDNLHKSYLESIYLCFILMNLNKFLDIEII